MPDNHLDSVTVETQRLRRARLLLWQARQWVGRMEAAYDEPTHEQRKALTRCREYIAKLEAYVASCEKEQQR